MDYEELTRELHGKYDGHFFARGQTFILDPAAAPGMYLKIEILEMEFLADIVKSGQDVGQHAQLCSETVITIETPPNISIKGARNPISFDFDNLGIGGLDEEFKEIFRRAFATRLFPAKTIEAMGINYVRGMLLFGPPGCGKTLMARKIGQMLNGPEPKIVNGPEILNKFVGASEENIRNLFKDAEEDQEKNGDDADLHVIVFDEIDAICKARTGASGPGNHDSIVNQLLSKIDGVKSLNNILLIGMTNRKELIDEALLRPGRLEVHMEIPLPNAHGRGQILRIHMAKLLEARQNETPGVPRVGPDVNVEELAEMTKNFTGAEIEGVIRNASQFAMMDRHLDMKSGGTPTVVDPNNIVIFRDDYERAISMTKPAFGTSPESLNQFMGSGMLDYGPKSKQIRKTGQAFVDQVKNMESSTDLLAVLFKGPAGSGKTALAATLANSSEYPFIKCVSPEDMVGMHESAKVGKITKVFDEANRSPLSIVILDDIERLIEYVGIGPRFSNPLLQTLQVLTKKRPTPGHRLLVLATTSSERELEHMDLLQGFHVQLEVPWLTRAEVLTTLGASGVGDGVLAELEPVIAEHEPCPGGGVIGIKKLLLMISMAQTQQGSVTKESFMEAAFNCNAWDY